MELERGDLLGSPLSVTEKTQCGGDVDVELGAWSMAFRLGAGVLAQSHGALIVTPRCCGEHPGAISPKSIGKGH